jgi:hypothetical protein
LGTSARRSKAQWILITELHVEAQPFCVARVLDWIQDDSSGLMGAPITTFSKFRNRVGRMESLLFEAASRGWNDIDHWNNVRLRGTVLRTRSFLEAGGFDARYELACDIAFGLEAGKQGHKFGRIASAHAYHWEDQEPCIEDAGNLREVLEAVLSARRKSFWHNGCCRSLRGSRGLGRIVTYLA